MWIPEIKSAKAIGPYSIAAGTEKHGGVLFMSGQIPLDPASGEMVGTNVKEQTQQVFKNIKAVLAELGLDVTSVIKTTVFLTDMNDFAAMNAVYGEHITDNFPARSTVAVAALPKGSLVEIECIVQT